MAGGLFDCSPTKSKHCSAGSLAARLQLAAGCGGQTAPSVWRLRRTKFSSHSWGGSALTSSQLKTTLVSLKSGLRRLRRHKRARDTAAVLSQSPTLEGGQGVGALISSTDRQTGRQRVINHSHLCADLGSTLHLQGFSHIDVLNTFLLFTVHSGKNC